VMLAALSYIEGTAAGISSNGGLLLDSGEVISVGDVLHLSLS